MPNVDYAAIEVDDLFLDAWTGYSFASDMFTPADAFRLSIGIGATSSLQLKKNLDKLRSLLYPGAVVKFYIGHRDKRTLQGTGIIDAREIENDAENGTTFSIEGRDFAAYLVDSAAPLDLYEANDTFVSVARRAVAPWGIVVRADPTTDRDLRLGKSNKDAMRRLQDKAKALGIPPRYLSEKIAAGLNAGTISFDEFVESADEQLRLDRAGRLGVSATGNELIPGLSAFQYYQLKVKDAKPQSGETVWEFLERHAKRLGFLMRMGVDGTLILHGCAYNQEPAYKLTRKIQQGTRRADGFATSFSSLALSQNNIISGGERYDASMLYKKVLVYGRAKGDDASRSPFKGEATDHASDAIPHEKTLILHDNSIKTVDEANKRAALELARSRQGAQVLHYVVRGHGANGHVFATDTIAQVEDDIAGINGPYYVISRTFQRNGAQGPTTDLKLVAPGSIALA